MLKIVTAQDLIELEQMILPKAFQQFMKDYYKEMLIRFKCTHDSIKDYGCIFVFDSKEEIDKSGLRELLEKHPPVRVIGMTLYDDGKPIFITQIMLFVNGGYACNIFALEEHLIDVGSNYYNKMEEQIA